MDNQVQVWQKLIEYMESTGDFLLEQAPDLIQQVLRYEKIAALVSTITAVTLLAIALSFAYYFWNYPGLDKHGSRDFPSILGLMLPLAAFLPLLILLMCSVDKIIKICVAPKFFLIELFLKISK